MKKIMVLGLTIAMGIALVGCNSKTESKETSANDTQNSSQATGQPLTGKGLPGKKVTYTKPEGAMDGSVADLNAKAEAILKESPSEYDDFMTMIPLSEFYPNGETELNIAKTDEEKQVAKKVILAEADQGAMIKDQLKDITKTVNNVELYNSILNKANTAIANKHLAE